MIIEDILHVLMSNQHNLYVPRPLNIGLSQFSYMQRYHYILGKQPQQSLTHLDFISNESNIEPDIDIGHIFWGNNWEASSSSAPKVLQRLVRMDMVDIVRPEAMQVGQADISEVDHQLTQTVGSEVDHQLTQTEVDL
jgi:hypothetical protein